MSIEAEAVRQDKRSAVDSETTSKPRRMLKFVSLYATMVAVSTCAIFILEHATVYNAFRTALVAAVGKTFAANWVSSFFE